MRGATSAFVGFAVSATCSLPFPRPLSPGERRTLVVAHAGCCPGHGCVSDQGRKAIALSPSATQGGCQMGPITSRLDRAVTLSMAVAHPGASSAIAGLAVREGMRMSSPFLMAAQAHQRMPAVWPLIASKPNRRQLSCFFSPEPSVRSGRVNSLPVRSRRAASDSQDPMTNVRQYAEQLKAPVAQCSPTSPTPRLRRGRLKPAATIHSGTSNCNASSVAEQGLDGPTPFRCTRKKASSAILKTLHYASGTLPPDALTSHATHRWAWLPVMPERPG